jgi:hypothetical protein
MFVVEAEKGIISHHVQGTEAWIVCYLKLKNKMFFRKS